MKRATLLYCLLAVASLVAPVLGDCYGQNPRFSNGRLNGNAGNRLFNSENNGAGGYRWGPTLTYYERSELSIEWTSQHSCGNDNTECNIIIQYICSDASADGNNLVRDGTDGGNINNDESRVTETDDNGVLKYGMHENREYFVACNTRSRNKGLFIATQNLGDSAQSTRQNQGANGHECTEERDYYPYWAPTPWRDIAVLTDNHKEQCKLYQAESQNVKGKFPCTGAKNNPQPIVEQECKSGGGTWSETPSWGLPKPECLEAPWGRDNHLGNGRDGQTHRYNWTLPSTDQEPCLNKPGGCSCALRIRYNISTADTTNWGANAIDSRFNGENSPIKDDPNIMVAGNNFTIDIDDNQFFRTFQDRTHSFFIQPRPEGVSKKAKIYNLNVRGKRGNIVNTFPATEYDFVPSHLHATVGDYIHFQWTGAETNDGGNNQGQGRGSTDRHNIVQIEHSSKNYPVKEENFGKGKGKTTPLFGTQELRQWFSNIGQTDCPNLDQIRAYATENNVAVDQVPNNCFVLNKAPTGYFNGGLLKMNNTGDFYYMNSRSNQFSNRSQKGLITVRPVLYGWQIGLIVAGAVAVAAVGAAAGSVIYAKKNPHSSMARAVGKIPGLNRI